MKFRMKPLTEEQLANRYYKRALKPGTVIVLREKHEYRYFPCENVEQFGAMALLVLNERWGSKGYWGKAGDQIKAYEKYVAELEKPEVTVEQFESMLPKGLRNGSIMQDLRTRWKKYSHEVKENQQQVDIYRRIAKALKERDGFEAAQIMLDRSTHEYETFTYERLERPWDAE